MSGIPWIDKQKLTESKQAWQGHNFMLPVSHKLCMKSLVKTKKKKKASQSFYKNILYVICKCKTNQSNILFLTAHSLKWFIWVCLLPPGKKLSTHGQCERGVEGSASCPGVLIQTSWMPFPMGIMNVKVVKRYGALDTQRGLADSSWEKGEGSWERKENTGNENRQNYVEFTTLALKWMPLFF